VCALFLGPVVRARLGFVTGADSMFGRQFADVVLFAGTDENDGRTGESDGGKTNRKFHSAARILKAILSLAQQKVRAGSGAANALEI
jgi:hypothetical protein